MIELSEVTKKYGNKTAVDRLSLRIEPGELFAFLGPNGAGKTTTIKLVCGLLFPTAGSVRVGGFDMQTQGDQARQMISYVPDQPYLYEKLTGREFLQFIADMYSLTASLPTPTNAALPSLTGSVATATAAGFATGSGATGGSGSSSSPSTVSPFHCAGSYLLAPAIASGVLLLVHLVL